MCIFGRGNAQWRQTDASVYKYCFNVISAHYPNINMITSSALAKVANCKFDWCKKMKVTC